MVSCLRSLSTLRILGYMPAHRDALTTAQFSELVFRSRMSPGPLALTKPDALSWPNSWVLVRDTTSVTIFTLLQVNSLKPKKKMSYYPLGAKTWGGWSEIFFFKFILFLFFGFPSLG